VPPPVLVAAQAEIDVGVATPSAAGGNVYVCLPVGPYAVRFDPEGEDIALEGGDVECLADADAAAGLFGEIFEVGDLERGRAGVLYLRVDEGMLAREGLPLPSREVVAVGLVEAGVGQLRDAFGRRQRPGVLFLTGMPAARLLSKLR